MNRKNFLSNLIAFGGLSIVPQQWTKSYHKVWLLECYVAGFRYYDGPQLLSAMKIGDQLELAREPNNTYDNCAIALNFQQRKIGFVPASKNEIISKLMDNRLLEIKAEIINLDSNAKPWEQVSFGVYNVLQDMNPDRLVHNN